MKKTIAPRRLLVQRQSLRVLSQVRGGELEPIPYTGFHHDCVPIDVNPPDDGRVLSMTGVCTPRTLPLPLPRIPGFPGR